MRDYLLMRGAVLLCAVLALPLTGLSARVREVRPGDGYPGALQPYRSSSELKVKMSRFGLTAGRFCRDDLPNDYLLPTEKFSLNSLSYLLYRPKRGTHPVPMVVYFGGTGEQGDDLICQFGQTVAFEKLTDGEFQKRHPCYVFAPLMPPGTTMRAALPGDRSRLADLTCDAMYAIIASLKAPSVDTNRLYVTGLSWGGVASFELSCGYPGRFAACVPISCIQSPYRIPQEMPGNYWMFYNESAYASVGAQRAIKELEGVVRSRGGDFRRSTFPSAGHDAWRNAWSEDAVWEWMFSMGADRSGRRSRVDEGDVFRIVSKSLCKSSVPGCDEKHGPERVVDGLDTTAYVSCAPVKKGDWLEIEFPEPVKGEIRLFSGYPNGETRLFDAAVESASRSGRWRRVGGFSGKTGEAHVFVRMPIDRLRVVYNGVKPRTMVMRKIVLESK